VRLELTDIDRPEDPIIDPDISADDVDTHRRRDS
jgi:hypothetical protein